MMRHILAAAAVLLGGCAERGVLSLTSKSAVDAPVYAANKVLFLEPNVDAAGKLVNARRANLKDGYQLAETVRGGALVGTRRSVKNRQPISILVSRAYLPATARTCNKRPSDALFSGKGRDIAVLLDLSTSADREEFIAVWYERNVVPDQTLSFQDLLVYSSDAWDAKYPPYFRMRLVDVSSERDTAVGALLDQVRASSATITSLAGAPAAAPVLGVAALAARQVLAHEKNKSLVDFTFQLYGEHLLAEAGGVPLGVLQTGGMLVTAPPCEAGNAFWENDLQFDHRLNRIVRQNAVEPMPYIFATVLTADLAVPQIVRTRSAEIMRRLTDPQIAQAEIEESLKDVTRLQGALEALNAREQFRRRASKDSFAQLVTGTAGNFDALDTTEKTFYLNAFFQVTGRAMNSATEYKGWMDNCSAGAKFNAEAARFEVDPAVKGKDGAECWPA